MSTRTPAKWRLIFNPSGDVFDIPAYGASVAEGRIAGKYQLSTTLVPDTVIIQRVLRPGIVAGADVSIDREEAEKEGVAVARLPRSGRNGARAVGTVQLSELMARSSRRYEARRVDPDAPAVLIYTSGTTGLPKGAMITHRNIHFQCTTIVRSLLEFKASDRVIGTLPLYHVFGLANSLLSAVHYGACLVLVPRYSPRILLDTIEKHKATILPAVPTMYQHLLAEAQNGKNRVRIPDSLRHCISGGAPLTRALYEEFSRCFSADIMEGYGLTESTSAVAANGVKGEYRNGSIGRPGRGVEMKIIDTRGNSLPPGEEGEIAIRSTTVFAGYWNNAEAGKQVLSEDGWLYTGDLGYVDEDGFYFITDRKKDIIIRNGFNISPREVEEVLAHHPEVLESAVVARKGDRDEEIVVAFVVPRSLPAELQDDDDALNGSDFARMLTAKLKDYANAEMAHYKRPQEYRLCGSLPRTATGKVLRRELRHNAQDARLVARRMEHVQN